LNNSQEFQKDESAFICEIVILLAAGLATKGIVQAGEHCFGIITILIFIYVELSRAHATANLVLPVISHDRCRRDNRLFGSISM
jgi:hypothetical protein